MHPNLLQCRHGFLTCFECRDNPAMYLVSVEVSQQHGIEMFTPKAEFPRGKSIANNNLIMLI